MKNIHISIIAVAALLPLQAQEVTTQQTTTTTAEGALPVATTYQGTVTEFSPGAVVVNTGSGEPIRITTQETTTFVDAKGLPVAPAQITAGLPVAVDYVRQDNQIVARRVVVRPAAVRPVATIPDQNVGGSLAEMNDPVLLQEIGDGTLVVKSKKVATPVQYVFTDTTIYLDAAGNKISPRLIKAGTPIRVNYTKVGDKMIATRVELVGPAVEAETSTTTTTTTIQE